MVEEKKSNSRREEKLKIDARGGGGILVIGGALIAAALGTAFVAHRARKNSRGGGGRRRRRTSEEKDVGCDGEIGQREEGDGNTRRGLQNLLPSVDRSDHWGEEISVESLLKIEENTCEKSEDNQLEVHIGDGVDINVHGVEFRMPKFEISQNLKELEFVLIDRVREEEVCPSIESQEEERLSTEEDGEKGEEGSEGTGDSSIESSAEAVWPTEVIEHERDSPSIDLNEVNHQLDIPRKSEHKAEGGSNKSCGLQDLSSTEHIDHWQGEFSVDSSFKIKETTCENSEFVKEIGESQSSCENFEMVMETRESQLEANTDDGDDVVGESSFWGEKLNIPQIHTEQNLEELEISLVKKEEGKLMESKEEGRSSTEEVGKKGEDRSEGTGDSSIESSAKAVWLTEVIEQEKDSSSIGLNEVNRQLDIPRKFEHMAECGSNIRCGLQDLLSSTEHIDHWQGEFSVDSSFKIKENTCENSEFVKEIGESQSSCKNFEMVMETRESQLEANTDDGDDVVGESSFWGEKLSIPQIHTEQNLEELEISLVKKGGGKLMESKEEGRPSTEEDGEKGEEGWEGTGDSSIESSVEPVWPTEVIEQERDSPSFDLNEVNRQLDIPRKSEHMAKGGSNITCGLQDLLSSSEHIDRRQAEFSVDSSFKLKENTCQNSEFVKEIGESQSNCENFEMVMETRESQLEANTDDGDDVVGESSFWGEKLNIPRIHTEQNLEEMEISLVKEEEEGKLMESKEEGRSSTEEVGEKGEEGSEGTCNSSIESSAEAVWPTEVIEQEKDSSSIDLNEVNHQLDIPRKFEHMAEGGSNIRCGLQDHLSSTEHIDHWQGEFSVDSSFKIKENTCGNSEFVKETGESQSSCKNFEMVMETRESQLEANTHDGDDVVRESSFWGEKLNIPQIHTEQNLEEREISLVKKEEEGKLMESKEEGRSSTEEDGERGEGPEGSGDSSIESSTEAVWPTEVIEEEKDSSSIDLNEVNHQLDIPRKSEHVAESGSNIRCGLQDLLSSTEHIDHWQGEFSVDSSFKIKENTCENSEFVSEIGKSQSSCENFEMVMETRESQFEANTDDGDDVVGEFSFWGEKLNIPQIHTEQNLEELEISLVKEEEEGKLMKSTEEEIKSSIVDEGDIGENGSEGASSIESCAEAAWPAEVIEQEKDTLSIKPNKMELPIDISGKTKDMVGDNNTRRGFQNLLPFSNYIDQQQEQFFVNSLEGIQETTYKNSTMVVETGESLNAYKNSDVASKTRESPLEANFGDGDNLVQEFSFSSIEFKMPQDQIKKNLEESDIARLEKEEEKIEEFPLMDSKEEEIESYFEEDGKKAEEGSDRTGDSPMDWSAEAVWSTEVTEQEKMPIELNDMKHQLEIPGKSKDMVGKMPQDQIKKNLEESDIARIEKEEEKIEEFPLMDSKEEEIVSYFEVDGKKAEEGSDGRGNSPMDWSAEAVWSTEVTEQEKMPIELNEMKHQLEIPGKSKDMVGKMPQDQIKKNLEESDIARIEKEEEKIEEFPLMDSKEEEIESYFEVDGKKAEEGSDGRGNSPMDWSAEAVWSTEVTEQEKMPIELNDMKHQLEIPGKSKDMVGKMPQDQIKKNLEESDIARIEKEEEKIEEFPLMDSKEEEIESYFEVDGKKAEEGSDGRGNSPMDWSAEAVWSTEVTEQEKMPIELNDMKHQLEIPGKSKDMVGKMPQDQIKKNLEESDIARIEKAEEKIEEFPLMDSKEEEIESYFEVDGKKAEEGSDGRGNSPMDSSAEAVWSTEVTEQEKMPIELNDMKHQLEIPGKSKDMVGKMPQDQIKKILEEPDIACIEKEEEKIEEFPLMDSKEEEIESYFEEDGKKAEEGSDGTGDSPMDSSAEAVWSTEVTEQEKMPIELNDMKHQLEIPGKSKDMVGMVQAEGDDNAKSSLLENLLPSTECINHQQGELSSDISVGIKGNTDKNSEMVMETREVLNTCKNPEMVMETGKSQLEANINEYVDVVLEFSPSVEDFNVSQDQDIKNLEESDISIAAAAAAAAEEEEEEEDPSMESQEEKTKSSIQEDGERAEVGSKGTWDSSTESSAEAIWPTNALEKEKGLSLIELKEMKHKSDIPRKPEDMVSVPQAEQEREEYQQKVSSKEATEVIAIDREKGRDYLIMGYSKVFFLLMLVLAMALGLLAFAHDDRLLRRHSHLPKIYNRLCQLFFPSYNKELGEV